MLMGVGIRNAERSALIALAMLGLGAGMIVTGVAEMNGLGRETLSTAVRIGFGIPLATIGLVMFVNFQRGAHLMKAMRRGDKLVARWTLAPDAYAAFCEANARRNALGPEYRNSYEPPETTPAGGVEVIFAEDAVMIGDDYFGLSARGMFTFGGIQIVPGSPASLEFGLSFVSLSKVTTIQTRRTTGLLRVPISAAAKDEGRRVLRHFEKVRSGEIVARPDFYPSRMRIGLYVAGLGALVAAAGFGLEAIDARLGAIPLVMAVCGSMVALGGLVLALLARLIGGRSK